MKNWVIAGLVSLSGLATGCASSFRAITVSSILAVQEEHELVSPLVQRYDTADLGGYLPKLVQIAKARGITVHFVPDASLTLGELGMLGTPLPMMLWGYNTGDGHIYISEWLGIDERFGTLVHELGHSLQPRELDGKQDSQVFAETLSVIVCKELGKDFTPASFPYIHEFENRHKVMQRYSGQIDKHARQLLSELRK